MHAGGMKNAGAALSAVLIRLRALGPVVGLAVLATGCGSLPTIVPDMARSTTPVQIDSARGPLSSARSRDILAKLKLGSEATHIFDRHLALEQEIGRAHV